MQQVMPQADIRSQQHKDPIICFSKDGITIVSEIPFSLTLTKQYLENTLEEIKLLTI